MSKKDDLEKGNLFYFSDKDCMVYRRGGHYRVVGVVYIFGMGMATSSLIGTIKYINSSEGWCFNPRILKNVPSDILVNIGYFIDELNNDKK